MRIDLINGISSVLQKILKYCNGIAILTSFVLASTGVFLIFVFDLNDSESFNYHLDYLCNIAINFQMFLNNYHYILSNYTLALLYQYL